MVVREMQPKENKNTEESAVEEEEMEEEYDDVSAEEFNALNSQLDALDSALDDIEQKNADIQAQLLELLEANKAMRKQMQEQPPEPNNGKSAG